MLDPPTISSSQPIASSDHAILPYSPLDPEEPWKPEPFHQQLVHLRYRRLQRSVQDRSTVCYAQPLMNTHSSKTDNKTTIQTLLHLSAPCREDVPEIEQLEAGDHQSLRKEAGTLPMFVEVRQE